MQSNKQIWRTKNREYFQEMAEEIKIKNNIARKVQDNRLSVIRTPEGESRSPV